MSSSLRPRSSGWRSKIAASAVLAVVLIPAAGDANPIPTGTADASSTLVRLVTSAGTVSVATDDAQAHIGAAPRAYARFISGTAADQTVGAAERTTTKQGERQTATVGDGSLSIGDLLSIGTAGASVDTELRNGATSAVDAQIANASLFDGWLAFDGGMSMTSARALEDGSTVHREITIGGLRALPIGALLQALNISPLDLTCDAIRQIGEDVGHDASSCQSLLQQTNAAIAGAVSALQDARDDVLAQRDAIAASIEAAQTQLASLQGQLATAQSQLATLEATLATLTAQRNALTGQLAGLQATLGDLQDSHDSLTAQIASLESQTSGTTRSAVEADRDTVTSCDGLTGIAAATCQATLLSGPFITLASTYGVDLSGLGFTRARSTLLGAIDTLLAAFDALDAATAQLATVDAQISSVQADIADLQSQISALDAQIDSTTSDVSDVQADIDTLQADVAALNTQIDTLNAQLDEMINALAVIDAASPADTTCMTTSAALDSVAALEPSLASEIQGLKSSLDGICAQFKDEVEALLAVPLITVDGIHITLDVSARVDDPVVVVTGTLGSVRIGETDPIVLDMPAGSDEIPLAQELLADAIGKIAVDTGFGLPVPEIEFLAKDQSAGLRNDGTWFAHGSITFLKLTVPAGTVTVPDQSPLGVLEGEGPMFAAADHPAGGAGTGSVLGAPRGVMAAGVDTQGLELDLGTFNADGSYMPASTGPISDPNPSLDGGAAKRMPKTGVESGPMVPGLCFALAAWLGRKIRRA